MSKKKIHQLDLLIQKTPRKRSYAEALKKGNSKTNIYLRRALNKTSIQDITQKSIRQQLDIQNNKNNNRNNRNTLTAKETSERDDIKYKEMQGQIKILTAGVTKPTSLPRKYCILPRNKTIFSFAKFKKLPTEMWQNPN